MYIKKLKKVSIMFVFCVLSANTLVYSESYSQETLSNHIKMISENYTYLSKYSLKLESLKQIFLNFKQFLEEIGSKKSKIFTKISNKNRILLMKNFADYFFQEMRRLCIQNIDEVEQILNSGPAKDNYDSDDSENKYNLDEMNSDMLSKKKIFSVDFKDKNEKIFKKELDLLKKKKQNLLSDFSYFTGQEKKSRFSKSKTLKNFEEKFSKYLKKYGEYLDLLLSERNRNFNEELLQGKIDFIQKIEIEKKEDEIKKIINEKNLGILEKLSMFVKKIL